MMVQCRAQDSVTSNGFTADGGVELVITGTGFDGDVDCANNGNVLVGGNSATVVSWSSTEIVAESQAFAGSVDVHSKIIRYLGFTPTMASLLHWLHSRCIGNTR